MYRVYGMYMGIFVPMYIPSTEIRDGLPKMNFLSDAATFYAPQQAIPIVVIGYFFLSYLLETATWRVVIMSLWLPSERACAQTFNS